MNITSSPSHRSSSSSLAAVEIDGSQGEGGGQILRTALTLSLVTGRPLHVRSVRGGRRRPGLLRQHLTALEAAAAIGDAQVDGAQLGSPDFRFTPRRGPQPGNHHFAVGSAGSAVLVLQTVLPALLLAEQPSTVVVEGGTHADWAPSFDYFERVFLDQLRRIGFDVSARLERYGFFPAGGGRIVLELAPTERSGLHRPELLERGADQGRLARVVVSQLPRRIAERELEKVGKRLGWKADDHEIVETHNSICPGNAVLLEVRSEHVTELFQAFGKHGRSAEKVGSDAARAAKEYLACSAPVGEYLADQLLVPMVLIGGGCFRALKVSRHTSTNLDVIRHFVDLRAEITPDSGENTGQRIDLACAQLL